MQNQQQRQVFQHGNGDQSINNNLQLFELTNAQPQHFPQKLEALRKQNLIKLLAAKAATFRSQKQSKLIMELLRSEPYFLSLANNYRILYEISTKIEYRRIKQNSYVYHFGQLSECFYILIRGQIQQTMPGLQDEQEQEEQNQVDDLGSSRNVLSIITSIHSPLKISLGPQQIKKKTKKEDIIVRNVKSGECFGEISVGQVNKRTTNAIAKEESHLIVIKKQFYDIISRAHLKSSNKIKFQFLSSLPLFHNVHRYTLQSFIYFMEEIHCNYNTILFHQNDPIRYIYIISKGEFKEYKEIKDEDKKLHRNTLDLSEINFHKRKAEFRSVGAGQILGDAEAFIKIKHYEETCICKCQQGLVYRVDKSKFLKKLISFQNKIENITKELTDKYNRKMKNLDNFTENQMNNDLCKRFLTSKHSQRKKSAVESKRKCSDPSQNSEALRKLSLDDNNFFKSINKTIKKQDNGKRISVNRSIRYKTEHNLQITGNSIEKNNFKTQRSKKVISIPSAIQDIVEIVGLKTNYQQLRKQKKSNKQETIFKFDMKNIPIFIRKKYEHMVNLIKKQ